MAHSQAFGTPDTPFVKAYGVPVHVAQTTYVEIFDATLRTVLEGGCPNCNGRLAAAGWCRRCRLGWAATADPQTRRAAIILDDAVTRLRWTSEPIPPIPAEATPDVP